MATAEQVRGTLDECTQVKSVWIELSDATRDPFVMR